MPICPFCRKPVDPGSIWCSCGANLVRYPNLPVNSKDVKDWLAKYEPQFLASSWSGGSLLERAKKQLMSGQDKEISANTKINAEITEAKSLIKNFLLDCRREGLVPTVDIGSLRRDRWRQWKRIPTEYRQHAPLKNFKLTPGYFFETSVADFKDEYCLGVDGGLYKHQLNAPDPFELEELLNVIPAHKLAEALAASLVELLRAKQQPDDGRHKQIAAAAAIEEGPTSEAETATAVAPKRRLRLPFGRGNRNPANTQTGQETVEVTTPTTALEKAATEQIEAPASPVAPVYTAQDGNVPGAGMPQPAAPAVKATPKRRVGKADRRVSATPKAVTPERRAVKADRRAAKVSKEPVASTAKAVTPERRAAKTDRRTTAKTVAPERRAAKTDRRAIKSSKGPATSTIKTVGAAKAAPAAEPENGSREQTGVRLEPTKS